MIPTRAAIALLFFSDGLLLGSWASRVPAVQASTGLTNAALGVALLAAPLAALVAMPAAGWLSARIGSRSVSVSGLLLAALALEGAGRARDMVTLALALFAFGGGFGAVNGAANAQGVAFEGIRRRRVLSSFHAAFSVGGLAGAGLGSLLAGIGVPPSTHFGALLLGVAAATAVAGRRLLVRATEARGAPAPPPRRALARPPRGLLVLGAAAFCTLLAEGAAADWSAAFLSQSVGASAAIAALGYTAFSIAMATSRTLGDRLTRSLGPTGLARVGGAIAASGLGGGLIGGSAPVALAGFACMGLGLGVVVPVLFRAAGTAPGVPATVGLATVSTIGWLGFLAGPPAIGVVAGGVGLRAALVLVVIALAALTLMAGAADPQRNAQALDRSAAPSRAA